MARPQLSHRNRLRIQSNVNDNYCVKCVTGLKDCACVSVKTESLDPSPVISGGKDLTSKSETVNLHVNSYVVNPVLIVKGYPQNKGVNPSYCYHCQRIKCVKDVSCVDHLCSVNLVTNVPTVAPDLPVGARLHKFGEKWPALGTSSKVVTVLREGYTLPFQFWPNLTRSLTVISCYVNSHKNLYLLEALHHLLTKNAVEPVATQKSLVFFDQLQSGNSTQRRLHPPLPVLAKFDQVTNCHKLLCKFPQEPLLAGGIASPSDQKCGGTSSNSKIPGFLQQTIFSPQTQQPVETHLGPEHLEHLPKQSFAMETPETVRTSLQTGEWVTSIDFKDAYFHIPIHSPGSTFVFTSRVGPTISKHCPLVHSQHP